MENQSSLTKESLLSGAAPPKAIVKLAIPATLALLAKAVYNIVDTAYISMLDSDEALAASYAFGAKNENRFQISARFALKGSLLLTVNVAALYILLAKPFIMLFNRNPLVIEYGKWLLISQVALYPAFGLCYMMTITFQTIGASKMGLFLSVIRQGLFYVPFILWLPRTLGVRGIYFAQPCADILTILACLLLIKPMKRIASEHMIQ